ncbi:MAG: hypothetical protein O7J95_02985, partial [Planctomycetota bacterium]|nr:hypothetical protein [Planctomycetota bacterium]
MHGSIAFSSGRRALVGLATLTLLVASPVLRAQGRRCFSAEAIEEGTFMGNTSGTLIDGDASCGDSGRTPDAWYRFTPASDCRLEVDTCGSDFDTVLSIHNACPGRPGTELACSDDACGAFRGLQSSVAIDARAGERYLIRVSGYLGSVGNYVLRVSCVGGPGGGGDRCVEAQEVGLGVHMGSTAGRRSDGAASCGDSTNSPDAWFRHTVEQDCLLVVSTCGSDFDTVISLHSGCPGNPASEITCNDDACGVQSSVGVVASAGTTYFIRVSGFGGASGRFPLELRCRDIPQGDGPDVAITNIRSLRQVGRLRNIVALSMESAICNVGSAPMDWFANPDARHPFLVFNAYRRRDDRFEQIGQSWIKHGFQATQQDLCGRGCVPFGGGDHLGIGCTDIYGVSTNGFQGNMSPRSEVNPFNGEYRFPGSHIAVNGNNHPHDAIQHRLQVADADLDRPANPGAAYFVELYALSRDDADRTNSLGWKAFTAVGSPGGTWRLAELGAQAASGPALDAWPDARRTVIPEEPMNDGRCYLAAKATDNGDGTWHYEYALFNLDMDRGVQSFSIPVVPTTRVTNIGFHAVNSHDENFHNQPWSSERTALGLLWSTDPFVLNRPSNPLRWGTLYNFRFDADAAPADSTVTLVPYKLGVPNELRGSTVGPTVAGG